MRKTMLAIFVAAFLLSPFAKQVRAQDLPEQPMSVGEDQLRAFAKVYVEVNKIRQTYEPRLKEAKSEEESKQIQNEAVSEMQTAAARQGLTAESYRQIFESTNADEHLRKKVIELIIEEEKKS